jgi:hypothetical protein
MAVIIAKLIRKPYLVILDYTYSRAIILIVNANLDR